MKKSTLIWFLTGLLIGSLFVGAAYAASPGDVEDPIVSLSYLKAGVAFTQVTLNDGEKLSLSPGEEFILLEGNVRLECVGDFTACNISKGKSSRNPTGLDRNHLIIFTGNSSVSVIAKGKATCLVRGITLE